MRETVNVTVGPISGTLDRSKLEGQSVRAAHCKELAYEERAVKAFLLQLSKASHRPKESLRASENKPSKRS